MADEVPMNPPVKKPRSGGGARSGKSRSARPGITPANSPDPIPAVMRAPVTPSTPAQRTVAFRADSGERLPQADSPVIQPRVGDIGGLWSRPVNTSDSDPLPRPSTAEVATTATVGEAPATMGRADRVTAIPPVAATRAMAAAKYQNEAAAPHREDVHREDAAAREGATPEPGEAAIAYPAWPRSQNSPAFTSEGEAAGWEGTAAAFDVDAVLTPGRMAADRGRANPNSRAASVPADWPRDAKDDTRSPVNAKDDTRSPVNAKDHSRSAVKRNARHDAGKTEQHRQGGRVPPSRAATSRGSARVPLQPRPGLLFQPVLRVRNMTASVTFFEFLGAELVHGELTSDYVLMQVGTVQLGLVAGRAQPGDGAVELNFGSAMPLDELEARLRERRVTIDESVHFTDFGPRLHVRTPDGLLVRISQLEPIDGG
jgi:hypothetical protein